MALASLNKPSTASKWFAAIGIFTAAASSVAQAAPRGTATCQNPAQALGVSRVVEIDTAQGPLFGLQQYKEQDFLAKGEVVLTFDDGPLRPYTQPVVDALEAQCTKATFFMVGSQAIADPEMVKQIARKGHTIGTHTWTHANLRKQTPLQARKEMELGFSAVAQAAGQPIAPFFRFPFLSDTKAMIGYAQTRQFGVFSIEIDSLDYKSKSAAAVHQEILSHLAAEGKGILLFHDIQPATAQALPGLLEALRQKGYRVVHMKPKAMASTLPEFDTIARDANARKQVAAASSPLANRSVTWGAGAPATVAGANTPIARPAQPRVAAQLPPQYPPQQGQGQLPPQAQQPYQGQRVPPGVFVGPTGAQRPVATAGVPSPIPPGTVQPQAGLPPSAQPGAAAVGVGDPAQQTQRIARPRASDDWRTSIFSR